MTEISKNSHVFTVINVFTVEPEKQQALLDTLATTAEQFMKKVPGFVSQNVHKGLDGTVVANYVQWSSQEAYHAMLENPEAQSHIDKAAKEGKSEHHFYQVYSVTEAPTG